MSGLVFTLFAFIGALALLIAVHEYGHFWVARRLGVRILKFSIGFGRALWTRKFGADDTEFVIGAIPLGGYVKMLDEREGEVPEQELHRAFNRQSLATRTAIVAAGPVFNLVFALFAFWLMYVSGVPGLRTVVGEVTPGSFAEQAGILNGDELLSVDGEATPVWDTALISLLNIALDRRSGQILVKSADGAQREVFLDLRTAENLLDDGDLLSGIGLQPWRPQLPAVLGELVEGDPAEQAGLRPGDEIMRANGKAVENWLDWVEIVRRSPGQPLRVRFRRATDELELLLTPAAEVGDDGEFGRIGAYVAVPEGFGAEMRTELKYGPLEAMPKAVGKTYSWIKVTFRTIWEMLSGAASVKNISGPITIAKYAGESAEIGLAYFLRFLGVVSISLGVLNLLPIPILDGGHLMYYLIEFVKGSPLSEKVQALGLQLGVVALMLLMSLAFYNDIVRLLD